MQLTQFSERLTDQYGLAIDMTDLIQHTSVRTLAECLTNDEKHKNILSSLFGQSGLEKQPEEPFPCGHWHIRCKRDGWQWKNGLFFSERSSGPDQEINRIYRTKTAD